MSWKLDDNTIVLLVVVMMLLDHIIFNGGSFVIFSRSFKSSLCKLEQRKRQKKRPREDALTLFFTVIVWLIIRSP
jgi:uncharacterized membrane protein